MVGYEDDGGDSIDIIFESNDLTEVGKHQVAVTVAL